MIYRPRERQHRIAQKAQKEVHHDAKAETCGAVVMNICTLTHGTSASYDDRNCMLHQRDRKTLKVKDLSTGFECSGDEVAQGKL